MEEKQNSDLASPADSMDNLDMEFSEACDAIFKQFYLSREQLSKIFITLQKYILKLKSLMKKPGIKITNIPTIKIDDNPDFLQSFLKRDECINVFKLLNYEKKDFNGSCYLELKFLPQMEMIDQCLEEIDHAMNDLVKYEFKKKYYKYIRKLKSFETQEKKSFKHVLQSMYVNNRNGLEIYPLYKFFDSLKEFLQQILNDLNKYGCNIWDKIHVFGNPLFFDIIRFPLVIDFLQIIGYTITTSSTTESVGILSKNLTENVDTFEVILTDAISDIIDCQACVIKDMIDAGEFNITSQDPFGLFQSAGYVTAFGEILIQLEAEYGKERNVRQHSNYDSYAMLQARHTNFGRICRKMKSIVKLLLNTAKKNKFGSSKKSNISTQQKQESVKLENGTAMSLLLTLFQFKNVVKFFNKLGMMLATTVVPSSVTTDDSNKDSTRYKNIKFEFDVNKDLQVYTKALEALDSYIKANSFRVQFTHFYYGNMRPAYFEVIRSFQYDFSFNVNNVAGTHNYYNCLHTSNLLSQMWSMLEDVYAALTEKNVVFINAVEYESILNNRAVIEFVRCMNFEVVKNGSVLKYDNTRVNGLILLKNAIDFGKEMDRYYFCLAYLALIESDPSHSVNQDRLVDNNNNSFEFDSDADCDVQVMCVLNEIYEMIPVFDSLGVNGNRIVCNLFVWMHKMLPDLMRSDENIFLTPLVSQENSKYACWVLAMEKLIEFFQKSELGMRRLGWFKYLITRHQEVEIFGYGVTKKYPTKIVNKFLHKSLDAEIEANDNSWDIYLVEQQQQQKQQGAENNRDNNKFPNFRYRVQSEQGYIFDKQHRNQVKTDDEFYEICQRIVVGNNLDVANKILDELVNICLAFSVEIAMNVDHIINKDNLNGNVNQRESQNATVYIDAVETKTTLNDNYGDDSYNDNKNSGYIRHVIKSANNAANDVCLSYRVLNGFYCECTQHLSLFLEKFNFDKTTTRNGNVWNENNSRKNLYVCNQLPRHETLWNAFAAIRRIQSVLHEQEFKNSNQISIFKFNKTRSSISQDKKHKRGHSSGGAIVTLATVLHFFLIVFELVILIIGNLNVFLTVVIATTVILGFGFVPLGCDIVFLMQGRRRDIFNRMFYVLGSFAGLGYIFCYRPTYFIAYKTDSAALNEAIAAKIDISCIAMIIFGVVQCLPQSWAHLIAIMDRVDENKRFDMIALVFVAEIIFILMMVRWFIEHVRRPRIRAVVFQWMVFATDLAKFYFVSIFLGYKSVYFVFTNVYWIIVMIFFGVFVIGKIIVVIKIMKQDAVHEYEPHPKLWRMWKILSVTISHIFFENSLLVMYQRKLFLNKLFANIKLDFIKDEESANLSPITVQSHFAYYEFWQQCVEFVDNSTDERDLLLRICCINYVISLYGIWYNQYDKDYQFCQFILKSANVYYYQNIDHLSDLIVKTGHGSQKSKFPSNCNVLQSLDFQLIGMDCDRLLTNKQSDNNNSLIHFIQSYFGKMFIIGKIITMFVIPILFGCYVALFEMNKSYSVVGMCWCWICLVFGLIVLFLFYGEYNKDKNMFCIFPFGKLGMLPCEFYSFSLVENHYNNILKCLMIRQTIEPIVGTDVTTIIEQYMQPFHQFCQKQDPIQSKMKAQYKLINDVGFN